jgi:DNA-directed RNA polymerase subunit M/transcription elongation factor TFIIS
VTTFYGVLDAGRSRHVTRNGDAARGVRVNATIQNQHARGIVEVSMDDHGRWSLVTADPRDGGYVTRVRGDLAAGTIEVAETTDFACAECGTKDAHTYVVTTLDQGDPSTRTEVCLSCYEAIRE